MTLTEFRVENHTFNDLGFYLDHLNAYTEGGVLTIVAIWRAVDYQSTETVYDLTTSEMTEEIDYQCGLDRAVRLIVGYSDDPEVRHIAFFAR